MEALLVLDLLCLQSSTVLLSKSLIPALDCFRVLSPFTPMGRPAWKEARSTLQRILSSNEPTSRDNENVINPNWCVYVTFELIVSSCNGQVERLTLQVLTRHHHIFRFEFHVCS
ncbi:unnamed protein product [Arabidopsis halleri]